MLIDLGGGTLPHPRADVIIDLHHPKNAPAQDAAVTPWLVLPYVEDSGWDSLQTGSVDEVYASHFMEHIPRGQPLIDVMNEAWRVLKPGGTFTMILPLTGFTKADGTGYLVNGWQPYADPTHVNYWWFPEGLLYFCDGPFKPHANYGINVWSALGQGIPTEEAAQQIENHKFFRAPSNTWWSVRDLWEGMARLVKP